MSGKKPRFPRVAPGAYDPHGNGAERCPQCQELSIRLELSDDRRTFARNITHRCPRADDQMTAYNVILTQILDVGGKGQTVARFCSEHFNWHVHLFHPDRPAAEGRRVFCQIDTAATMLATYRLSVREFRRHGGEWVQRWIKTRSSRNAFGLPRP